MSRDPFDTDLLRLATQPAEFDVTEHPLAERKAHEASLADELARHEELRGTASATYAQFREAFDAGGGCSVLVPLRDAVHPADPLRDPDLVAIARTTARGGPPCRRAGCCTASKGVRTLTRWW